MHRAAGFILFLSVSLADVQMRWCHMPGEEATKCEEFAKCLATYGKNNMNLTVNVSCVSAKDRAECVDKIKNKEVDLVTLDRKEIVATRKSAELKLVVAEEYGLGEGVKYYGVAVAKHGTTFGIKDLKGKRSCHTGAGRTAGWDIPVGFLLSEGIMKRPGSSCNPYVAAANFFSKSCVPGALLDKFDPEKENPDSLCAICGGSGDNKCAYSSAEPYFGHGGALRCLADGAGDFAFFKHGTVSDMTTKDPKIFGNASDYQYLCADGSRKDIGQAKYCNLGTSPPQPVITWSENSDIETYKKLLLGASKEFGPGSTKFQMFNSTKYDGKDLLFKDSTKKLVDMGDKSLENSLEKQYREDMEALYDCRSVTATASKAVPHISFLIALILSIHSQAT